MPTVVFRVEFACGVVMHGRCVLMRWDGMNVSCRSLKIRLCRISGIRESGMKPSHGVEPAGDNFAHTEALNVYGVSSRTHTEV